MDVISKYCDYDKLIFLLEEERRGYRQMCTSDLYKYGDLIEDYNSFLKLTSSILKEITIKSNSISTAITISAFLDLFSFDNKFQYSTEDNLDIVFSKMGINVIYGKGCCRHSANFTTDLLRKMGMFAENFFCSLYDTYTISKLDKPATHLTNLIEYEGKKYVFDVLHGILFIFTNAHELENIEKNVYLSYQPELLLKKGDISIDELEKRLIEYDLQSKSTQISKAEYEEIINETRFIIRNNRDNFNEYLREAEPIKRKIYTESKKIK